MQRKYILPKSQYIEIKSICIFLYTWARYCFNKKPIYNILLYNILLNYPFIEIIDTIYERSENNSANKDETS